MNLLLIGADGQLGSELRTALAPLGELVALGKGFDLTRHDDLTAALRSSKWDAIVNAAAYTAVDRAESDRERARAVNAHACEVLACEAQAAGAWLVHYSTDYVFDGTGARPWRESDAPNPLNFYGASKLEGESAIRENCERHMILRTSWVYEAGRDNFVGSILKAACTRDSLAVVDDQWGTPTRARTIAQATAHILGKIELRLAGLYHFAAAGEVSRLGVARHALARARQRGWPLMATASAVRPAQTADMPSPARRPLNSRLDCSLFDSAFAFDRPLWSSDLDAAIDEWPSIHPG